MKTTFENRTTQRDKTLNIIDKVFDLPFDCDTADEVLYLINESNANFIQIAKEIQRDHGLFIKILSAANSSTVRMPDKVYTIERAISYLGLANIGKIIGEMIKNDSMKMQDSDGWYRNEFWRHSVFVANTSKSISEDLNYKQSGNAFTAGFIHDISVFVIHNFFPSEYFEIKDLVESSEVPCTKAEEIILGCNHFEIAKVLIEKWNLPNEIKSAVVNHYNPSGCTDEGIMLASIVHLADYITHWIGISQNHWERNQEFDEKIISVLKLNNNNIDEQIPIAVYDIIKDILLNKNREGKEHLTSNEPANFYS